MIGKKWKRKTISYKDDLLYEGEYWNGKGKVSDYKEDLLYEGEYFNGESNGKGKKYNGDGELKLVGDKNPCKIVVFFAV